MQWGRGGGMSASASAEEQQTPMTSNGSIARTPKMTLYDHRQTLTGVGLHYDPCANG